MEKIYYATFNSALFDRLDRAVAETEMLRVGTAEPGDPDAELFD